MDRIRGLRGIFIAGVMLLTAACGGLAGEPEVVATLPPRPTPADVTTLMNAADTVVGARIFAENCARCHGAEGKGDGEFVQTGQVAAMADFTDPATTQAISPAEWYATIRDGRIEKLMPPWGEALSAAEIAAVAQYTYHLADQTGDMVTTTDPQPAAVAPPATTGTIHGTVTNGTTDSPVTDADLQATLYVMNAESSEQGLTAPVINGEFTIPNVQFVHGDAYVVAITYQGMQFMSKAATPASDAGTLEIPITLYDKTTDAAQIEIVLFLTEVQRQGDTVMFTQIIQFDNLSQSAYVNATPLANDQTVSVYMPLPDGARLMTSALQPQYVFSEAQNVVYDTQPVLPGERRTLHIAYTMPFRDDASVTVNMPYRMNNQAEIMLPPNMFTLVSEQFSAQGTQEFASGTYDDYLAAPVAQGEALHFRLRPAAEPMNPNIPVAIGLSLAGIGLMTFSAVMYIHSNRMMRLQTATRQHTIETLARDIAALDARHEQGKINERKYRQQRTALKQQLAALVGKTPPNNP